MDLVITTSGLKPITLLSSGKKKMVYIVKATALVDEAVKVVLQLESTNKDGIEEILGTLKLGDVVSCEVTPESPE